jgi:hypothetical protein
LDHIAEQNTIVPHSAGSENDMDEDDPAPTEEDRKELIEFVGEIIGEAYLEKEPRKNRVISISKMVNDVL